MTDRSRVTDLIAHFDNLAAQKQARVNALCEEDDEESSHEANTFRDGYGYRVEWYHTAVGLVSSERFDRRSQARAWLAKHGFEDYTS